MSGKPNRQRSEFLEGSLGARIFVTGGESCRGGPRGGSKRSRGFFLIFLETGRAEKGLMNFVLVGSKVGLFWEGRQCCDEVS